MEHELVELSEEARAQNAMIFEQSVKVWPAFNVCHATMAEEVDGEMVPKGQAGFLMLAAPEFNGVVVSIGLCDESCDRLIAMLKYLRKGITITSNMGDMQQAEKLTDIDGVEVDKPSVN